MALAGALAAQQRQDDPIREQQTGRGVVDRDADPHRPLAGMAGDRHQSAHPLSDLVDPGPTGIGSVLAKAGDAAIDDARVDLLDRLVIDAEPVLDVGFVVLDDDVGALGELEEDRAALLALQVQCHRPLVAVQILEIRAVAAAAGGVDQFARGLDLDHLRAPIGELAHRRRPGAVGGQVNDEEIVQGQRERRHRLSPLLSRSLYQDSVPFTRPDLGETPHRRPSSAPATRSRRVRRAPAGASSDRRARPPSI